MTFVYIWLGLQQVMTRDINDEQQITLMEKQDRTKNSTDNYTNNNT
jgi:hypothetical protein